MPTIQDWAAGSHRFRKWNWLSVVVGLGFVAAVVVLNALFAVRLS